MDFHTLFPDSKPVIGMVHLLPLPGSPGWGGSMEAVLERALAEYIACPAFSIHPLPENVSDIEGALTEPLGVALHAVRLARIDPNEQVVLLGAGAIGICTLLVLLARGVAGWQSSSRSPGARSGHAAWVPCP